MERLTVSDPMKDRLIAGIHKTERNKSKVVRFTAIKWLAPIAACFVLLVAGVFVINNIHWNDVTPDEGDTTGPIDQTPWGSVEYQNAEELSRASGIEIEDLENIPFEVTETVYQDYENNLVEIRYSNEEESLSYRVSKGDEDNSGDYNDYSNVRTQKINGISVTLKGEGDLIYCVLYEKDGCIHSIGASKGYTLRQIEKMI